LKKILGALLLFLLIAGLLLPLAATNSHYYFAKEYGSFTGHLPDCWYGIAAIPQARSFYLIYAGLTLLWIYWIFWGYRLFNTNTPMQKITPDIYTPCPAGNGQYGTARWMERGSIRKHFHVWKAPRKKCWYKDLMEWGKISYKEVKHGKTK